MKLHPLLATLLLSSMASAQPERKCDELAPICSNYYVGASFGLIKTYANLLLRNQPSGFSTSQIPRTAASYPLFFNYYDNSSPHWGSAGPSMFLNFGYDHRLENSFFVTGIFASIGYNGSKNYVPYGMGIAPVQPGLTAAPTQLPYISDGIRFQGGLAGNAGFRFGVVVGSLMPFIRVGWEANRMQMRLIQPTNQKNVQVFKSNRVVNAAMVGMGLAFQVTKSFGVEGLIDWVLPGKVSFPFGNNFQPWVPTILYPPGSFKFGARMQFQRALISVKYCFPRSK
jgi:hypothetical protein